MLAQASMGWYKGPLPRRGTQVWTYAVLKIPDKMGLR
jgi:hypothetical protein